MKLKILQENLYKALLNASRFSSTRAQLPVLSNIALKAAKGKLIISSTNLEISLSTTIGAQVEKEGEITIPARAITEIVANLSPGTISLSAEKEQIKIESQGSKLTVLGMNASDFPAVPQRIEQNKALSIPKNIFQSALSQVVFATSIDETRPILTGVLTIFKKSGIILVATDGFRLSQKKIAVNGAEKESRIILPKTVLLEIAKLSGEEEEFYFSSKTNEHQVSFGFADTVLSSRLLEGDFPNYEKIIPKDTLTKVNVDKEEFLRVVKLSSVFAKDSANIIKVLVKKDSIVVSAESSQSGSQKTELDAKVEGKELEIAFNFRFVEDLLHAIKGESVNIAFSNSNAPGVFTDPQDDSFIHLIMPVRIQA
jgi:DNA polymerase-3 subunit beta